jgi:acetyl-CoA C-acetyltransferase
VLRLQEVDEVILGQILTAGAGPEPGPAGCHGNAGIPAGKRTAWGLNQLCGSGLRAVALGMQQIMLGRCRTSSWPGGQENDVAMAPSRHASAQRREDGRHANMVDTMMHDALTDAFNKLPDGQQTAENVAEQWQLSRDEQDEFAVASAEQGRSRPEGRQVQG